MLTSCLMIVVGVGVRIEGIEGDREGSYASSSPHIHHNGDPKWTSRKSTTIAMTVDTPYHSPKRHGSHTSCAREIRKPSLWDNASGSSCYNNVSRSSMRVDALVNTDVSHNSMSKQHASLQQLELKAFKLRTPLSGREKPSVGRRNKAR